MANLNKLYLCVGENYKDRVSMGYCGEIKTLGEWIDLCILKEKQAETKQFCDNYVISMIYIGAGKHLEPVKKI